MKMRAQVLLAAGLAALLLSGAAHAQRYGHPPAPGSDPTGAANKTNESNARTFNEGKLALQNKNFRAAESLFRDVLRENPTSPEANFLMGLTQMGQDNWMEAKKYLEIAVKKDPRNPDPKSRLAVACIKLGDRPAAMEQRAALQRLADACKGKCRNAEWIAGGLAMVDAALQSPPPAS